MTTRTEHQQNVDEFMKLAGQAVPDGVMIPNADVRLLRARLILEEAMETIKALGVEIDCKSNNGNVFCNVKHDDLTLRVSQAMEPNIEEVVDGCADISVVTVGTLSAFGVDDFPVLREVDSANLRKFGPGGYRRGDGKWIKPPDWVGPNIVARLKDMGWKA